MKKNILKVALLGCAFAALLVTSCEQDTDQSQDLTQSKLALAKEHAEKIGYNPNDIEIKEFLLPNGKKEQRIFIESDIALLENDFFALESMVAKQYRTTNLVSSANRVIDVIGYTGNDQFGLSAKARAGLTNAINNYKAVTGVTLRFNLTFGTNFSASDIVVYDNSGSTTDQGGVAGFPSGGKANKFVQIYNLEGFSTDVNEHVITHEIGHSIGFRHSDYFSRQSCGQSGESAGPNGAIYLTGTARGWDPTSLMNACFSASTNGEFNANDKRALDVMY